MSRDFHTMKRLSKITVDSVTEVLREDHENGEGAGLDEQQILEEIGVFPDPDEAPHEDNPCQHVDNAYHHVVQRLTKKLRACCEASENVEESRSMWTSFVYVPDSELEQRRQEQRRLQQKQEKFEDAIESDPDLVQKDKHLFVYQDLIEVRLTTTLNRFFEVNRNEIENPRQLAERLADRAKVLKKVALRDYQAEDEDGELHQLYRVFKENLVHNMKLEEFADAYAQTVTYGLLASRWITRRSDVKFTLATARQRFPSTSPFLRELSGRLLDMAPDTRISCLLEELTALLASTDVSRVFADEADPVIHFYEDFLEEFDKETRKDRGVYYTPDEVVSAMVHMTDDLVKERMGLEDGLASDIRWAEYSEEEGVEIPEGAGPDDFVVKILDPAVGTGTFLRKAIEVIHARKIGQWKQQGLSTTDIQGKWNSYVRQCLLPRIYGFEIMMAPYVICHLRLELTLEATGFDFSTPIAAETGSSAAAPDENRLYVFLTDTLQQQIPSQQDLVLSGELAAEAKRAHEIKNEEPISVILGNPPYDREKQGTSQHKGGWIRDGWAEWNGGKPLLADYAELTTEADAGGHFKNCYNLYVYFWRWAEWKAFERHQGPSVVAFITASSYLGGPGFVGMRKHLRQNADEISIVDLGGDQRGARKTPNVFEIQTPVCIGLFQNEQGDQNTPGEVSYIRFRADSKEDLLKQCAELESINSQDWGSASSEWESSFIARTGSVFFDWPDIRDIFPWQHSGCQLKRTWPIGEAPNLLRRRWRKLLGSEDQATMLRETGQKKIDKESQDLIFKESLPAIEDLPKNTEPLEIVRYSYRTFDRQWILRDKRLGDRFRPVLWRIYSDEQIYFTGLLTKTLGEGPALIATPYIPDLDHFCGRGGKDVIPLWRNREATEPNITDGLLEHLATVYEERVTPTQLACYVYGVLSNSSYTEEFSKELQHPGPRVPLTRDVGIFKRVALAGKKLIGLHTFGERLSDNAPRGSASVVTPVSSAEQKYPESFSYSVETKTIHIGDGEIAPVSEQVWNFEVSGLQVVKSWLDYRKASGAGKKTSPLDDIRPRSWTETMTNELLEVLWTLEATIDAQEELSNLLGTVVDSELILADELPKPSKKQTKYPRGGRIDRKVTVQPGRASAGEL